MARALATEDASAGSQAPDECLATIAITWSRSTTTLLVVRTGGLGASAPMIAMRRSLSTNLDSVVGLADVAAIRREELSHATARDGCLSGEGAVFARRAGRSSHAIGTVPAMAPIACCGALPPRAS